MKFIALKDSAIDGSFVRAGEIITLEQEKAEAYEKALMIESLNKPEPSAEPELSSTKSDTSFCLASASNETSLLGAQDPTDGTDRVCSEAPQQLQDSSKQKDKLGSSTKSGKKNEQK